jgi:hypothetical protein
MDTVGLRVSTKEFRGFSICNVNNVSRLRTSARSVAAANNISKSVDVFNKHNISLEYTFPFA